MATHHQRVGTLDNTVTVTDLHRSFDGSRDVINGFNLSIRRGEFVVLLGRSGSGKSTILRALAGLDRDVSGYGQIDVPERISVVFQDSRLIPWLRVAENIGFGLDSTAETKEKVSVALAEVELAGRESAWPSELSGGEQQRVALARSLVREPELLLADEPFAALDALTKIRMHHLLRQLCAVHQPAVLLITHDVDEAIALADRIIILENGDIATDIDLDSTGTPEQLRARNAELRARLLRDLGVEDDH